MVKIMIRLVKQKRRGFTKIGAKTRESASARLAVETTKLLWRSSELTAGRIRGELKRKALAQIKTATSAEKFALPEKPAARVPSGANVPGVT